MKKNGFTLVELLAVVTIISILLLLVAPKIANQLNNSKSDVNEVTKKIIYSAAEKYMKDNNIEVENYETKCISVENLQDEEYLSDSITDNKSGLNIKENKSVKVTYNEKTNYELVDKTSCEKEVGMLSQGLYPVSYIDDKWVVVSPLNKNKEWYNYDEQKWANAVTLLPGIEKNIGDEVKVDGTEASMMLVYIPRYEYKIEGIYGKGGTDAAHPGEIEVNFISKDKIEATTGYRIHPAFTFGEKQLSGIWIGKFEISHTTRSQGNETGTDYYEAARIPNSCNDTCEESKYLRTLPDKPSLRYNYVKGFYYILKNVENDGLFGLKNVDTHMIKNSEWGAVAYLSQSKYGKYGNNDYDGVEKEIFINNSSIYYTGRSGGNISGNTPRNEIYPGTNTSRYSKYGYYTYDGYLLSYNTNDKTGERNINKGTGASTTGNIYGIYDMSGGSDEYVMGAYGTSTTPIISNSFFNSDTFTSNKIEKKYYDIFLTNDTTNACESNQPCYGHALSETSGWYNDDNTMVNSNNPWMLRGGHFLNDSKPSGPGIFSFFDYTGRINVNYSSRIVFSIK